MFSKNEKYFTLVEEKPGIWENWLFFFPQSVNLLVVKANVCCPLLMYVVPKTVKTEIAG
jgi:hypothetical protein